MIKRGDLFYPSKRFRDKAVISNPSVYKEAGSAPLKFWEKLADEVVWRKRWKKTFVHQPPHFKWFLGGKLNITESCLEANLETRRNKVALIWESEDPKERPRYFTYYALYREVNRLASGLKRMGVRKGDRVGIYLPMIPEAQIAMLACARIGAVHAVVFSAFSPSALSIRLEDTKAKILITADGYYRGGNLIELKKNADEGVKNTKVKKVVVVRRMGNKIGWKKGRDIWWEDLVSPESDYCEPEMMDSEAPFFILYTSGSTGKPKGVLHTCGGYAVQAKFTGQWLFDLKEDDIFWCTADVGWITGHTYVVYSPLINGTTSLIFEGVPNYPNPERWCQIIEKYGITTFYTAPTAIRMFQMMDVGIIRRYGFESIQLLGSVGEPIDRTSWLWFAKEVGRGRCPVVDTWWQTETGGILISSLPGIGPFKPTFTGLPFPGLKFDILDDNGKSCSVGQQGNLVLLPPFSPGLLRSIYQNDEKYIETYWSQYGNKIYFTSDLAYKDKGGLIRVVGRSDDVIKVAGHRLSTAEMEDAVRRLSFVSECAVIGVPDKIKGEVPMVFLVTNEKIVQEKAEKEVVAQLKKSIGPIALPSRTYLVRDLPKTRSGKIMRRILRKLFTGEELGDLSTLANPDSVEGIRERIKKV